MIVVASGTVGEIEVFRHNARTTHKVVRLNVDGLTQEESLIQPRPGGVSHYCLRSPDGHHMRGKFVYREIVVPERLVFINSFSDEAGNLTRHPFSSTWPLEMLSTVTFAEHPGKTTVTLKWSPLNATEPERKTFEGGHQ